MQLLHRLKLEQLQNNQTTHYLFTQSGTIDKIESESLVIIY